MDPKSSRDSWTKRKAATLWFCLFFHILMLFIHNPNVIWTTNVFPKCLVMRAPLAYLGIYICTLLLLHVCISYTAQFEPLRWLLWLQNSDTDVCGCMGRRLKPVQTLSPSDPSLKWLDKQVSFPNCVWKGNGACRAAAGPMAAAKRVHFVQHTGRIWRADVLSGAIQLQT